MPSRWLFATWALQIRSYAHHARVGAGKNRLSFTRRSALERPPLTTSTAFCGKSNPVQFRDRARRKLKCRGGQIFSQMIQ